MKLKKVLIFVFAIIGIVLLILLFIKIANSEPEDNNNIWTKTETTVNHETKTYSSTGQGTATMDKPIKAYLNPLKSYIRTFEHKKVKCVLESDPSVSFVFDDETLSGKNMDIWWAMPAGNYLIYPEGTNNALFSWD